MTPREERKAILNSAVEQFLDYLEETEEYKDGFMGVVVVGCELEYEIDEDGEPVAVTGTPYYCSDQRKFVQYGLFSLMGDLVLEGAEYESK